MMPSGKVTEDGTFATTTTLFSPASNPEIVAETRCGERLPLVQRTVGVKHEYRRILDRIFGLFQLIRIFRRNDGFGAGAPDRSA